MAGQELRRIGALIAALPAKCREAFVLRKVQGLSQREIAGRLRISENTVEKHVGTGLRLLMRSLARDADAAVMAAGEAKELGAKDHDQTTRKGAWWGKGDAVRMKSGDYGDVKNKNRTRQPQEN